MADALNVKSIFLLMQMVNVIAITNVKFMVVIIAISKTDKKTAHGAEIVIL